MRRPDRAPRAGGRREPLRRVLAQPRFHLLYLAMFAGLTAGLAVNANLKELAPEVGAQAAEALAHPRHREAHGLGGLMKRHAVQQVQHRDGAGALLLAAEQTLQPNLRQYPGNGCPGLHLQASLAGGFHLGLVAEGLEFS